MGLGTQGTAQGNTHGSTPHKELSLYACLQHIRSKVRVANQSHQLGSWGHVEYVGNQHNVTQWKGNKTLTVKFRKADAPQQQALAKGAQAFELFVPVSYTRVLHGKEEARECEIIVRATQDGLEYESLVPEPILKGRVFFKGTGFKDTTGLAPQLQNFLNDCCAQLDAYKPLSINGAVAELVAPQSHVAKMRALQK